MERKFKLRAFIALLMLWSFIVEMVSGIVLYVVPPGRIANWTNWKFWGITKHGWTALHTIFGYLFFIFACYHIVKNWKAILNYIRKKIRRGLKMRWELGTSLLLTVLLTAATLINLAPFSTVMDFGTKLKNSWEDSKNPPIRPHAEDMTLYELSSELQIGIDKAEASLSEAGITLKGSEQTIKAIAEENQISPADVFDLLIKHTSGEVRQKIEKITTPQSHKQGMGKGYGQMSLSQLARDVGISPAEALERLKAHGLTAQENETIRAIADKNNRRPFEIVDIIKKKP